MAGNNDPHDFIGPFKDLVHSEVTHDLFQAEVGEISVTTVNLQRIICHLEGGIRDALQKFGVVAERSRA